MSENTYFLLLVVVATLRMGEVALSRRNAARVLGRGGREVGAGHFPAMVALHALLLAGAATEVALLHRPFVPALGITCLVAYLLAQALRTWVVMTLGERWNIRVIVEPGRPPVTGGPFRFLRHPNYLAVAVEGAALPLIHGAYITAAVFSVLNACLLLLIRIPVEERALAAAAAEPKTPEMQA